MSTRHPQAGDGIVVTIEQVFNDVELTRRAVQDFLESQTEESVEKLGPGVITLALIVKMNMVYAAERLEAMGLKRPTYPVDKS